MYIPEYYSSFCCLDCPKLWCDGKDVAGPPMRKFHQVRYSRKVVEAARPLTRPHTGRALCDTWMIPETFLGIEAEPRSLS